MSSASPADPLGFEQDPVGGGEDGLVVDVGGFEGPLDLLLSLARAQKVDLSKIPVLALAEQYLQFIADARQLRIELAADYLVMAAWLAYLKSRLLLPDAGDEDEPSGDELASALAYRMQRLEAMRQAAVGLFDRHRLGRDVFARGMPEGLTVEPVPVWRTSLYDLLAAYASHRQRKLLESVHIRKRQVFSLQEARDRLVRLIGNSTQWQTIDSFLIDYLARPELRATARASALSASLELVKEGRVELRQAAPFSPLYVRLRSGEAAPQLSGARG